MYLCFMILLYGNITAVSNRSDTPYNIQNTIFTQMYNAIAFIVGVVVLETIFQCCQNIHVITCCHHEWWKSRSCHAAHRVKNGCSLQLVFSCACTSFITRHTYLKWYMIYVDNIYEVDTDIVCYQWNYYINTWWNSMLCCTEAKLVTR